MLIAQGSDLNTFIFNLFITGALLFFNRPHNNLFLNSITNSAFKWFLSHHRENYTTFVYYVVLISRNPSLKRKTI